MRVAGACQEDKSSEQLKQQKGPWQPHLEKEQKGRQAQAQCSGKEVILREMKEKAELLNPWLDFVFSIKEKNPQND